MRKINYRMKGGHVRGSRETREARRCFLLFPTTGMAEEQKQLGRPTRLRVVNVGPLCSAVQLWYPVQLRYPRAVSGPVGGCG